MEADKHEEQTWQLCFGIIYFIFLAIIMTNVIINIHEHEIHNNNAKKAIITTIKNSHNIKEENHNKVDY